MMESNHHNMQYGPLWIMVSHVYISADSQLLFIARQAVSEDHLHKAAILNKRACSMGKSITSSTQSSRFTKSKLCMKHLLHSMSKPFSTRSSLSPLTTTMEIQVCFMVGTVLSHPPFDIDFTTVVSQ